LANSSVSKSKYIKKAALICLILSISFGLLFSYMNHLKLFSYGNPFSLMIAIYKIEVMKEDLVIFSEGEDLVYFISKDNNEMEYFLNNYGWELHRQKGYATTFKRNKEEILVTADSIWNLKYLVHNIPKEYKD
jgi:hypothetical protein